MKKVKVALATVIFGASIILTGCDTDTLTDSMPDNNPQFEQVKKIGGVGYEVKDKETGIHYYYISEGYQAGMTPVIESDGTIRGAKIGSKPDKEKQLDNIQKQIKQLEAEKQKIQNNK